MTFAEIMADVIRTTLVQSSIATAERLLFRNYNEVTSRGIVARLLAGGTHTAKVFAPEETGVNSAIEVPAILVPSTSGTLEVIPFVVVDQILGGAPAWCGSQGFASRLRTAFASHSTVGVSRILLLFDERPVETEQTTACGALSRVMESFDTLLEWFRQPQWQSGFVPDVYDEAMQILQWFQKRLKSEPRWIPESPEHVWERAVAFVEACRQCSTKQELGNHLPQLGVLFRDDALFSDRWAKRIEENAVLASRLDDIRRNRVLDPLTETESLLDLGPPDDNFHVVLMGALRSARPVSDVVLTYNEIASRLRSREQRPAWLDVTQLECRALDDHGVPQEPPLEWRLLGTPTFPPEANEPADLVIPSPSSAVEVVIPVQGDLRAFLHKNSVFYTVPGAAEGALVPGHSLVLTLSTPSPCEVIELVIREKKPGRGRAPRASQVVRIAVVAGHDAVSPEGAVLDVEQNCFLVDGASDSLLVQVGPQEVRVEDDLPPTDGTPVEVTVAGARFQWAGEDRAPGDTSPVSPATIRMIEQLGLRTEGDPTVGRPLVLETGQLGAVHRTIAILDITADLMHEEAKLLLAPRNFVGVDEDNNAAESEIRRVASTAYDAWIAARIQFFEAVCDMSKRRLGGVQDCHSVYLIDTRDPSIAGLADEYVDLYVSLLHAAAAYAGTNANPAILEPLLLCDRAFTADDALRIAPTHPASVALLATLQRGLLSKSWQDDRDIAALDTLLQRSLLNGALPWVMWRGKALTAVQRMPLLWRAYGSDGGTLDTSDELSPVIVEKVKRLLSLAPHLNQSEQTLFINVEVGRGSGDYILESIQQLQADNSIRCSFDLAVVARDNFANTALVRLFTRSGADERNSLRESLHGFIRVRAIANVADREAHLVFRMEAARSERRPFSSMSVNHLLARDTGFSGGLSIEAARFASSASNEVVYTRYVAPSLPRDAANDVVDGLWKGPSRSRYRAICAVMQHASIGLHTAIAADTIPTQSLRQIADSSAASDYDRSFITVHCDPAQGPEFFVGERTTRSGVFLVECSDRGSPQLPGRDIVSVTSRITPFRAALAAAVSGLPAPLDGLVDGDVAKGLLRDINLLRGTEVFDFLREISQANHVHMMDGLDNVLALRFLLSQLGERTDYLALVISMKDLASRSPLLKDLRGNDRTKCDDIIVLYIPRHWTDTPTLEYRLVEVKFGERRQQWAKAQKQLSSTAQRLAEKLPVGIWNEDSSAVPLMLERDLAWAIHETLERYRAFGLLGVDEDIEEKWRVRQLFHRLNDGNFRLTAYQPRGDTGDLLNGTALMLDPSIPGDQIEIVVENATEYVTLPRDVISQLLVTIAAGIVDAPTESVGPLSDVCVEVAGPCDSFQEASANARVIPHTLSSQEQSPSSLADPVNAAMHSVPSSASIATPNEMPDAIVPSCAVRLDKESIRAQQSSDVTAVLPSCNSPANTQALIDSVFDGFIGNEGAVTRLKRFLTIARLEGRRALDPIGLFGPASTGKTELARRIATAMDLPTVELSETTLRSADDLAEKLRETARNNGVPLRMVVEQNRGTILKAPPLVVFIDEVHLLRPRVQESLLKALEPDDRTLLSTHGTIDTSEVTFIIATTDPGDLGNAFKTRIARFDLREYTADEIVAILQAQRDSRNDLPAAATQFGEASLKVLATVGRLVPRKAIGLLKEAAREVSVGLLAPDADALVDHFWTQLGIDRQGLADSDRRYLELLFPDRVVGVDSLAAQLGEGQSTISEDIEPYLLRLGLIDRARGGRSLTRAGRETVAHFRARCRDSL